MKNNFDIINNDGFDVTFYANSWHKILNTITDMLNIDDALELSLNIISKEMSLKLNQTYRQKNYVADVLSFPVEPDNQKLYGMINMRILGDIFICFELAQEQADKYEHNLLRELSFLFLHGLLHLLGYDHQTKSEEDIMFALQDEVLRKLKITRNK
ncbi:rRNA maturation RNase YbeY [Spiroplasma endosymbiont of Agriotes lineatus]|uniref:rRNA maturation RNase YbeY n=1 Tax=Spiroplasma endosymbiont of Agriotes lineatus TaxID=3077930 RepID=UPI0030D20F3B